MGGTEPGLPGRILPSGGRRQPRIPDEPVDTLLVVAESGLSLKPTRKSGRLQGITVQRGESE